MRGGPRRQAQPLQHRTVMRLTPPSLRGLAAIAVLLSWGGSLGWLAARQLGQSDLSTITATAALRLAPGDAWFAVRSGETQVGVAGITIDTLSPGYRILETYSVELPRGTTLLRRNRTTDFTLAPTLTVSRLSSRSSTPGRRQVIEMQAEGTRFTQSVLTQDREVVSRSGEGELPVPLLAASYRMAFTGALGAGQSRTMPLLAGWPMAVRQGGANPDDAIGEAIFADSSELSTGRQWLAASFDTVVTRSVVLDAPTGAVRLTVDTRGGLIALEHPFGVIWRRTDFGIALQGFRERLDSLTPFILASLPTLVPLVGASATDDDEAAPGHRFLVSRRDGGPLGDWALASLNGGRQRTTGDGILVVAHRGSAGVRGRGVTTVDPFIQHEDTTIAALAAELAVPLTTRDWATVGREIRRRVRIDTAATAAEDALSALTRGRARPDGMARLLVALVRASGGTARYVVGVAPRRDTLYTHAWAEVRDPSRDDWQSVDVGRRSGLADTDLVRIGWAGSSHPDDLLTYVADVRFTPAPPVTPTKDAP